MQYKTLPRWGGQGKDFITRKTTRKIQELQSIKLIEIQIKSNNHSPNTHPQISQNTLHIHLTVEWH